MKSEQVFTLVAALSGIAFGWFLNQRSERERRKADREAEEARREADRADERSRWFRDQRLAAYVDFEAAASTFIHLAAVLDATDYEPEQAEAVRARLQEAIGRIGPALAVLQLVAPKPVAAMASEVELMAIEVVDWVTDTIPLQGTLDRQRHWSTLGRWVGTLRGAARGDLAGQPIEVVPPDLPTTPRWRRGEGWIDPGLREAR